MDPITMEAFDHFPKVQTAVDLIIQKSNDFLRADTGTQEVTTEGSCFTLFSSSGTRDDKMRVKEQKTSADETKYCNEVFALQKLIVPLEVSHKSVNVVDIKEFPNNNPFKKRKLDNVHLDQGQSITEQISVVTDDKTAEEILCLTPESEDDIHCRPTKKITVVIDDDIVCISPESQKSVNSTLTKKNSVHKVLQKKEIKSKGRNISKTPDSNKSSILHFFKRL
ncbi:hypothetical protein FRX31_015337 [Thalictrum thalictroides]|uniref:Uncharacterized protein n=1 Tax=Thalictrum thalictroides TaxID=46969 RepID=A0A7J6WG49_THATH|nr:hypothetical protein FRX31_015337 [Thalictrum thalictroides]